VADKVTVTIVLDGVAVRRLFRGKGSPTTNDLERRGRLVMARAKQLAPGSMKRKITSVTITNGTDSDVVDIQCSHPATLYVTQGTRPHIITPHDTRPHARLKFKGRKGKYTYAKIVHHPGTKANNFMTRALRAGGNLAIGS
jgi:hypothetical protein